MWHPASVPHLSLIQFVLVGPELRLSGRVPALQPGSIPGLVTPKTGDIEKNDLWHMVMQPGFEPLPTAPGLQSMAHTTRFLLS